MPFQPEMGLRMLEHLNVSNDYMLLCKAYFNPYDACKNSLEEILKRKPLSIFNLYNYYHETNLSNGEKILNQYYFNKNLLCVEKKNELLPLYIDNVGVLTKVNNSNDHGKISIIISAKNEEKLIAHSVESIINQSYKNIEIIFINDGSVDKTQDIFQFVCRKNNFSDFHIITLKKSKGPFYCRNLGLEKANGDFITFHDADDWAHPQRLELQLKAVIDSKAIASMSEMIRVNSSGKLFSKVIYPINQICMASLLFRAEIIKILGYFYTDLLGADSEYKERILLFYGRKRFVRVPLVLTFSAHRKNSRTTCTEYGVPEFGINKRRVADYEALMMRLYQTIKKERNYYVNFSYDQAAV
ncbi:glycosyltransferase involved in cell wall biogenesis [Legionella oakridgensis ATCC 33761 = DSM 21215]|uniref:Glycosyltransferase involved in cell wall biogenesis n=3 Tax=Legionella oakridgensis TaxID=29423 RepID=W0BB26_9GAMM|nr:glycosyltransferase involved in cell wall biogenesis [Legionella oakridgensis ATCC 33761 = DSM 21215]